MSEDKHGCDVRMTYSNHAGTISPSGHTKLCMCVYVCKDIRVVCVCVCMCVWSPCNAIFIANHLCSIAYEKNTCFPSQHELEFVLEEGVGFIRHDCVHKHTTQNTGSFMCCVNCISVRYVCGDELSLPITLSPCSSSPSISISLPSPAILS